MRCSLEETERYQTEQVLIKWIMALVVGTVRGS